LIFILAPESENASGVGQDEAEIIDGANVGPRLPRRQVDHLRDGADGLKATLQNFFFTPSLTLRRN
jgi:hypothetical protein